MIQFIKFCLVGASNTLISYLCYLFALFAFKTANFFPTYDYLLAEAISFLLSVAWSYYWNNRFVFKLNEHNWVATLMKTYISYSFTGLFLSSILLIVWVKYLHISEFIAPFVNLIVTIPLNFLINKFWTFKKHG